MDTSTYLVGFGGRFSIAPDTDVTFAPGTDNSLICAHYTPEGVSNCFVRARPDGEPELVPGATGAVTGIQYVNAVERSDVWTIESYGYRCAWPKGLKLQSLPPENYSFQLAPILPDEDGAFLFLRGPLRGAAQTPAPPDLIAPNQSLVDENMNADAMWLELEYEHEGTVWRQRHQYSVPQPEVVVLVTAQAPLGKQESVFLAMGEIAKSVQLVEPPRPKGFFSKLFGRR